MKLWILVLVAELLGSANGGKPHIFVYLSDDHSMVDSSLYGEQSMPTPAMEKMAAEGMVFTYCFVVSPSCGPSRAAFMTGLIPSDLDGKSFLPVLLGQMKTHRDVIYTTHAGDCLKRKKALLPPTFILPARSVIANGS